MDTVDGPPARLTVDGPVACVIRVQGGLDPRWADRLCGLDVTVCEPEVTDGPATTELRGELRDQAALLGVLTTLYNLHRPPARRGLRAGGGARGPRFKFPESPLT